jgi:hypothetical protein
MNELLEPTESTNYQNAESASSIVYNTAQTEYGWIIEARVPLSAPSSDRKSVFKWFEEYRREVNKAYPLWSTSFTMGADWYRLEIKRNSNPMELLNSLQEKLSTSTYDK